MLRILYTALLLKSAILVGQWEKSDSTELSTFTNALIQVDSKGQFEPVTDLSAVSTAGFFLSQEITGTIRVCNDDPVSLWVDGRFERLIEGCETVPFADLLDLAENEKAFVSFFSSAGLANLRLEQVKAASDISKQVNQKRLRPLTNHFFEFKSIGLLILLMLTGLLISQYSGRASYLLNRTFSLKFNTYEFANTQLFSAVGFSFCLFLCVLIGFFFVLYLNAISPKSFSTLMGEWALYSGYVLLFLVLKWLNAVIVSRLFQFKMYHEFQLFDYINLSMIFNAIIFLLVSISLILGWPNESMVANGIIVTFGLSMVMTILFVGLKFVNNTTRKKLPIISYLCATEIIPAIIIVGRFFK